MEQVEVLVSDTSILIDLERGGLIETCFNLPYQFTVPDILYDRELKNYGGPALVERGLKVIESDEATAVLAVQYARQVPALSAADAFAIALARSEGWMLLSGDAALRKLADGEGIECHGVLWIFDQLHILKTLSPEDLFERLTTIVEHPRCRLPTRAVNERLKAYRRERG